MPTRAVLFDFYGTLAEAVHWGTRLDDVLRAHGAVATTNATTLSGLDPLDGIDHSEYSRHRDAYVAWERIRLGHVADRFGLPPDQREAAIDEMHRAIKDYRLEVYADVADTLNALRARGLRLAVCSNWDWDLPELVVRLGLVDVFDAVVTSARVGARKPHPRIYTHTLELLGIAPAEAAFVGDSFGPDVLGPTNAGMRAFHVVRGTTRSPVLPARAARVTTLAELADLL